jgi:methionyl-tRNA synthetase
MIMVGKKILVTSALPYVNNIPHLGNIIGCVLSADVFTRYCRAQGYQCMHIGGTDEYGTATEIKALEEGVTPKEICDKYYAIHKGIYEWFGIAFDTFGRTSTPKHTEITQAIFQDLYQNGYIVEEETEQLYDEKAGMFLADRYIEGTCPFCSYAGARGDQCDKCGKLLRPVELINPVSKVSKTRPVVRKTKHLFIDLPKIEDRLSEWLRESYKKGDWSENTKKIAEAWLHEGLRRRAITRDLKWGVPVPLKGYENKVFYVWFDAPIGYISITANLTDKWKDWWMDPANVKLYNFIGKDNVPFHAVIFPSTLLGTGKDWTLVHHLSTTEFLNYEGGKFSKSRHVGVFGDDAMASGVPSDVWRYYLLTNRPEGSDSDFTWEDFRDKNNAELLANLGNLVNRTLVFVQNNFDATVPSAKPGGKDEEFLKEQRKVIAEATALLESVKLKDALHQVMHFAKDSNKYFQDNKPWELVKTDPVRAATVMNVLLRQVKDLAILCGPYLPATSASIFKQLAIEPRKWEDLGKPTLESGHHIGKPEILFRKLEDKQIQELKQRFTGKAPAESSFADLDLEVGEILSVMKHPEAEKLFIEKVKLGDGERQIVSGLVGYYLPEELVGKKVVIVKNLKPAKLRGVESQGMLLAAEGRESAPPKDGKAAMEQGVVEALFLEKSEVGDKVSLKGAKSAPKQEIDIKDFRSIKIDVKEFAAVCEGKPLATQSEELRTRNVRQGRLC